MESGQEADWYEIRLRGHVDERWECWFDGMTLERQLEGVTVLRGHVPDQSALHGLLARLRDLGLPLLSLTSGSGPRDRPDAGSCSPTRAPDVPEAR